MSTTAARQAEGFVQTPLFEGLARAGYVARGLIYIVIGICAVRLAQGVNGQPASQTGALQAIADQRFGHCHSGADGDRPRRVLPLAPRAGRVGTTPEAGRHSTLDRIGALGSAIAYATFCFIAVSILLAPETTSGNDQKPRDVTRTALDLAGRPLDRRRVGAAFLIVAGYQLYMGVSRKFLDDSKVGEMDRPVQRGVHGGSASSGCCARGRRVRTDRRLHRPRRHRLQAERGGRSGRRAVPPDAASSYGPALL